MIQTEYVIMHFDGMTSIVCTTPTKKGAERLMKVFVEYVSTNYVTSVTEVMSYRNETFFANGHRVWIEEIRKITGVESFKAIIGM